MQLDSSLWAQIKNTMTQNSDSRLLESYLEPVELVNVEQKENSKLLFNFSVPNSFSLFYVNHNLKDKIVSEIKSYINSEFEINFVIVAKPHIEKPQTLQDVLQNADESYQATQAQKMTTQPLTTQIKTNVHEEFTFSTFVVGKNSEFAHAATYNVSMNPGNENHNPLFIYGPSGMGKTHLLKAAMNQIQQNFPHYKVNYLSAEKFLNDCVTAMRRSEMDKFRHKYRESSDILVVDDVQFIGKGQATQEEFFHTINVFIENKKQVIFASDRMPKDILGLEDRSRTRLELGLIADITMPDIETRLAILKYKAEKLNLKLQEDVYNYIARISKRSIRELEGNIRKIKMYSELQGISVNLELARKLLSNHESSTAITGEEIMRIVAEYYKIKISDLKSSSRTKPIVIPRQIAMFLIKKFLDKSLVDIGKFFGDRDHTTVINSLNKVSSLQAKDLQIKSEIDDLETQINNIVGL